MCTSAAIWFHRVESSLGCVRKPKSNRVVPLLTIPWITKAHGHGVRELPAARTKTSNKNAISYLLCANIALAASIPRIRQVTAMHFLRLFLMAWLALGFVSVLFLFWLCKRTAATVEDSGGSFSPTRSEVGTDYRAA